MKSKKLIALGQRKRQQPQLDWLEQAKAQLEQSSGDGELLTLSFAEWCQTLRIKTDKGLVPFELFDWQEQTADLIVGPDALTRRAIALLSSRQTGKTSLMLALAAYLAQSRRQFTGVIIHRTTQDTHLLSRRVKRFLNGVPLKTDSLSLIEFADTDSALHFRSSNPTRGAEGAEGSGRGLESVDFVLVEEASHTSNLKDVLGVIAPALTWSALGIVVFVGTASSKQSYYYENLATAAGGEESLENSLSGIREGKLAPFQILDRGKNAAAVITNWRAISRFRDESDFLGRVQDEFDLSDSQMDSEYELKFGSSIDSACFDFALLQASVDSELKNYTPPAEDYVYLGVDPSGQGKDYSVCIALHELENETTGERRYKVCHLYRKRTGTAEQHLNAITQIAKDLDASEMLIETNSMGQVWLENLSSMSSLACRKEGYATSQPSKEALVARLQMAIEKGTLIIPKGPILNELLAFRQKDNGKLEASGKEHDDCVMALGLALTIAEIAQKDKNAFRRIKVPVEIDITRCL